MLENDGIVIKLLKQNKEGFLALKMTVALTNGEDHQMNG